ncbi:MAG: MFS transporter [Limnohabitans sp.]
MRFWVARLVSTMGLQMMVLALGWLMYEITADAWDLGLLGLYQFLPALALSLFAGQFADRHHRGRILAICIALQLLVALLLMAACLWGQITPALLMGAAMLIGISRTFQLPAQQALIPLLVPPSVLARATALNAGAGQAAILGGPAIGGFLMAADAVWAFGACVLLFLVGFTLMCTVRYSHVPKTHEQPSWTSLLAGGRYVWSNKTLLGAMTLDLLAMLLGGATALLPVFAKDVLQVGPVGLGVLRAAPAAGALLVSVMLARVALERQVGAKLMVAIAIYGASMLVFGLSTQFAVSLCALVVSGAADMVNVVVRHTLVQMDTPEAMRGRVGAINAIFMGASNQLGEFESGATAALVGPVGSVVLGGAATLAIAACWTKLFPSLWRRDRLIEPPLEQPRAAK